MSTLPINCIIFSHYGAAIVARRNQSAFPVVLLLALAYPSQVIGPILLLVILASI